MTLIYRCPRDTRVQMSERHNRKQDGLIPCFCNSTSLNFLFDSKKLFLIFGLHRLDICAFLYLKKTHDKTNKRTVQDVLDYGIRRDTSDTLRIVGLHLLRIIIYYEMQKTYGTRNIYDGSLSIVEYFV